MILFLIHLSRRCNTRALKSHWENHLKKSVLLTLLLKEARLHCHYWIGFLSSTLKTLSLLGNTHQICQKNPSCFKDIFKQYHKNKLTITKNIIKSDIQFPALFHSQFCILLQIKSLTLAWKYMVVNGILTQPSQCLSMRVWIPLPLSRSSY